MNCIGSEGSTPGQTDILYTPSRWIAGGIKICAISNFICTGSFLLERGGGVNEKGSKGKKVLLQDK
jgi:hypothetical protein